ncbi:MAG TPA: GEVED domain-containing protein, partial [Flavobacteriales bacterium]|nr:GEVED domain-containing protein [Flavobacteriales bacterium]
EGFNGTYNQSNAAWTPSFSIGYNGATPAGLTQRDRFAMQSPVTNHWSASGDPANHAFMPDCFSKFLLTPGTYTGPVAPPAIPVPANDELATAQVLTPNEGPCVALCGTYYTSRGATASADPTSCAGIADDDVWFTFTGNGTDSYTVTLRNSPNYDGDMEIFNGGVPVVCQSATAAGLIETFNLGVVSGPREIRVFDNLAGSGASGQFSICVNTVAAPPANDDICGAIGLTTAGTCINTQGNMLNATASPEAACTGTPNRDMWYSFSPLTTSDQIRVQSLGTVNAVLQVFSSDDDLCTGALTSVACVNNTTTGGLETYSGPWTLGDTYFIRVYHAAGGSASGLFNICITGQVPGCLTTSVPANAGTLCTTGGPGTLSWTAVAGAAVYDVYLDAGAGPATTLVSFEQAGTTYNTAPLANGGYSWRVVPKNAVGEAVGCTDRTFTVAPAPSSSITAVGPTSFCSPGSVLLTADNLAGTRVWSPGGATTPSITATATGNYTVAVTVGACTTVSAPVAVTAQSAPVVSASATPESICAGGATALNATGSYAYCASTHASGCGTDAIVLVELEDLSQASGCSGGAYFDYTAVSASLLAGNIYTVDVTMGSDGNQYAAAWIDYNADGDFDDVDEFLGASGNVGANGTASLNFEVPLGAANGPIRMRVIGGNDAAILGTQSCGVSSSPWGETEDYTVIISGGANINITYEWSAPGSALMDDPLSATPVASGVAPLPYTFTVTATSGLGCETEATATVTLDMTDTDGDGVIDCEDTCPEVVGVEGGPCVLNASPYLSGHLESCTCVPNACAQPVIIELRADPGHANEAGWEILDPSNFIVCKGGYLDVAYGPNQIPQTDFCCLEAGSYRLRVYDSAGDGFVSGGVVGGYQLREASGSQRRIIDNFKNFTNLAGGPPDISAMATSLDNGRFELPVGVDAPIFSSCDKEDWVNYQFLVATENPVVSAQFLSNPTNSGYEFWFFNPNGTYSYRRFRSHSTSDGTGSGPTRACHFKINRNVPLPPGNQATNQEIPYSTLLNVRIRGRANGNNLTFGPACRFKIDYSQAACPVVKLQDNPAVTTDFSCGVSKNFGGANATINKITATPPQFTPAAPAGQVRFQFRFRVPGEIDNELSNPWACIVRPPQTSATLYLNWTTGQKLKCNTTYEVDVRVSKDGGATWCVGGATTNPADCGVTVSPWGKVCNVTIGTSTFCPVELAGGSNNLAVQGNGTLTMFPNPNRGDQVFISLSEVATGVNTVSVDIFDLSGKKVTTRAIAVQDGNVNTYLKLNGDLAGGMYMVNITAGDKTYTERLVIQP